VEDLVASESGDAVEAAVAAALGAGEFRGDLQVDTADVVLQCALAVELGDAALVGAGELGWAILAVT